MKRDMDLFREILLKIEEYPAGEMIHEISIPGDRWNDAELLGHLRLIYQAGLVDGMMEFFPDEVMIALHGLSNEGHDLLDSIRNETVWQNTKETVAKAGGSVAIETLKAIAAAAMAKYLGLGG